MGLKIKPNQIKSSIESRTSGNATTAGQLLETMHFLSATTRSQYGDGSAHGTVSGNVSSTAPIPVYSVEMCTIL